MRIKFILVSILLSFAFACKTPTQEEALPILGAREPRVVMVDGKEQVDSVYHAIPDFKFLDQDNQVVTQNTVAGKIYVADFFFTTCPTICPKMKSQLLRVYEKYKNNSRVAILSHSIDPIHDSVAVLKDYAQRLGVNSKTWHFLTGDRDTIMAMAQNHYLTTAMVDEKSPGGYAHSGAFLLVDEQRQIRGQYDGTKEEDVNRLLKDMDVLLAEKIK